MTVLLAVLVLATVYGLLWRRRQGRLRAVRPGGPSLLPVLAELGHAPGSRATLLQFSSAFCAPCRATRGVLDGVSSTVAGVAHVEVDAESHLDLVRRLDIRSTPTTLVLDAAGRVTTRAVGAPTRQAVLAALGQAVG